LIATPDSEKAVLGSNPVDCQSLDGLPSGMALYCRLSSEGRQRRIYTIGTSVPPKKIKEKKESHKKHKIFSGAWIPEPIPEELM
jgi:hypothetical protein